MEINWITDIAIPLSSAVIGGILALIGVFITLSHERKERKKEQKEKVKPIVINYMANAAKNDSCVLRFLFVADDKPSSSDVIGVFKNTDNGILFIDYIETETKKYYTPHSSVVDKNTVFYIYLQISDGETFKKCVIHCHDVFETKYFYEVEFCFQPRRQSQMMIGNIKKD